MSVEFVRNYEFLDSKESKKHRYGGKHFGNVFVGKSLFPANSLPAFVSIKKLTHRNNELHNRLIENEIKIVKKLKHPNIVQYFDVFETQECKCIVMELFPLGNLDDYVSIATCTKFDIHLIMDQLLNALHYLHKTCKIVHRDIKLANILINWAPDYSLIVKICDFGISYCTVDDPFGIRNLFFGTRQYMAPEIMQGIPHSFPVDMWGLGVCMYRLFTKRDPFCLPAYGDIVYNPQLLTYNDPGNMTNLEKVLLQGLLCLDPGDRISTTMALLLCKECMDCARKFDEPSRERLSNLGLL